MITNLIIFGTLTVPVILGFVYDWEYSFGFVPYTVSVFATMSVSHFILQLLLGFINRQNNSTNSNLTKKYAIQITGWKEDADLFKRCLVSVKNQDLKAEYISFCSDGNDDDDEYMIEIFQKVFPDNQVLRLQHTINNDYKITPTSRNICITQPHAGKRHAMYSQIKILLNLGVDYIMFIDSDTIIRPDSVSVLLETAEHKNVDAITGDVHIYNRVNLLSTLVSLKYWYAFNVERSAQAFFKNVCCLSGPFSLYKSSMLSKIVDEWINQKFMGKECTFGDDRHLTNLVLRNNGTTSYTHLAVCYTDTPISLKRFITQQTRWSKSFIREYLINFKWFNYRQLWLIYDLNFMTIYSTLLTVYIVYLALQFDFYTNMVFAFFVLFSTFIRSLYAVIITRDVNHFIFILYSYVYILFLIPVKIWAMITINKTQWGTGNRIFKTSKNMDLYPVAVWNVFLFTCLITSIVMEIRNYNVAQLAYKPISSVLFFVSNTIISLSALGFYYTKRNKLSVQEN